MRMGIGLGIGINRSNYAQGIFSAYQSRVVADGGVTEAGACVDAVSSLLQSASLLLIPSGYKSGKAYAEIPTNGNGDLTWTRASDAWRTNADGLIQRVPWNLVSYSEDFSNGYWGKSNTPTMAYNIATAPNGTITADSIQSNSASVYQALVAPTISVAPNSTVTLSIYIKKETSKTYFTGSYLNFTGGTAKITYVLFDEVNGTMNIIAPDQVSMVTSVESVGNWWRFIVTGTDTGNNTNLNFAFYGTLSQNGTSLSPGIGSVRTIWGAQLNIGSTAQTYFPTTDRLNVPRLSYMYGSCPALLLEPQRTNLALRSEEFDNASWGKTASSITTNTTTSPDGNTTADTLTGDGTSSLHGLEQSISVTSGVTYSWSIYAKKNTNNFLQIVASSGRFGSNVWANFDLDSGVIGSVGSSTTASIVNVGNGWYRCTITATATATGSAATYIINLITSSTSSRSESNTLSTSVYLWGAQFEQGAYPTTYIPTTTASATRIADSFSRNNIYTNGLITSSGGTWFVELRNNIAYRGDGAGDGIFLRATGDTDNFRFYSDNSATTRVIIFKRVSNVNTQIYTTTTDTTKIAIKWNGTTADIFANGTKVVSATSFTATQLQEFATSITGAPKFIQAMALYPTPLSDTDCTTITSL